MFFFTYTAARRLHALLKFPGRPGGVPGYKPGIGQFREFEPRRALVYIRCDFFLCTN